MPIETLDGVILTGRAEMTNDVMGELARRGIRVAAPKTGRLRFCVGGATTGNVHLRLVQYRHATDPERTAALARWIVAGKLQNYRRSMLRWSWEAVALRRRAVEGEVAVVEERIRNLTGVVDGDRIRGIEGDGTRRYFGCLGGHLGSKFQSLAFDRRCRRPSRDPVNALMGLCLGLVLAELVGSLDAVGLDPQVGFLHRARAGRPSLALDLLEEQRAAVDRFVVALLLRSQVRRQHFEHVGEACYLTDEGRQLVLCLYEAHRSAEVVHPLLASDVGRWMLPTIQATLLARYLRGDLPAYPPYILPK